MDSDELLALLRLQKSKFIGDIIAKKLIKKVGSASQIFKEKASILQKIDGVGTQIITYLNDDETLKRAEQELNYILKNNIAYTCFFDDKYPSNLKHCVDAPILFFKKGNIDFTNTKMISIVGTRNMTNYGREFCEDFIHQISSYNPVIVSGFAYGVDICAHKLAVKNNLQTIAVLGNGFTKVYPAAHKKYVSQVEVNGGFITEFWHDEQPLREHFLKRNRIIAGLSMATVIIESATKGGSLVTADIANSYNRDVFALPGKITDMYSAGCNMLIQQNRAHLLSKPEEVVEMLNWDVNQKTSKPVQKQLFVELSDKEIKVYNYLQENGKEILDIIALKCEIPLFELSSILLQMELNGVIKPLPGKQFEAI